MTTASGSFSPNLVIFHRHQFKPVVWKKSQPVRRTRWFQYMGLLLLFTCCLSGVSVTAAAGYTLLTYLR